jgi:mannitol-specific phosphotransferase system IIBC component
MSIYLQILSLFLGVVVSVLTIITILVKFSDKLFTRIVTKVVESIDLDKLASNSELVVDHNKIADLSEKVNNLEEVCEAVKGQSQMLNELKSDINDIKVDRFKNSLRERIEYVINKKGKVDNTYWDYVVKDYNTYTNVMKLNTYMKGIYLEAEKLYIKASVKHEGS